jgi:Tol biopolymer transport system component
MSKKRRLGKNQRSNVIRLCIGILCVLCCIGVLCIRLLVNVFPVSISSPKLGIEQPLGEGEAIAFSYMRLDMLRPFELYILDDTNGIRSISHGLMRSDVRPMWSPDGAQIVYESVSGWATRYYLVDADGANHREITLDDSYKGLLRWSPAGSRLAYLAYYQQSDGSISNYPYLCVTEVTTGDTHQAPTGSIQDFVWMPDGQYLLAIVRADDLISTELYDADGNHQRRISEADYLRDAGYITISPDASKVAYISSVADEDVDSLTDSLYISALDGSTTKSVGTRWTEGSIVWSPDSTRIAFVALTSDFEYALYVANADGTELQELMLINTGDESGEIVPAAPAWSPDGTRIAISSFSSPDGSAVFVMNADGTERRQITAVAGADGMIYDLAWRPGE